MGKTIRKTNPLKILYTAMLIVFWMSEAGICGFASSFLLAKNFSNTSLGIMLGIGGLVSMLIQPFVANMLDQSKKTTVIDALIIFEVLCVLSCAILYFTKEAGAFLCVFFIVAYSLTLAAIPLTSAMYFDLQKTEAGINYGFSRALGCVGYSFSSFICGRIIAAFTGNIAPVINVFFCTLCTLTLFGIRFYYNKSNITKKSQEKKIVVPMKQFISNNRKLFLICISIASFCLVNKIMSSYMLQIVIPLGGDASDQGNMASFWSICEMIPMFFFSVLLKKFSLNTLIIVSGFANVIKAYSFYVSRNLSGIYAGLSFQMLSQGLFNPGIVLFLNSQVTKGETVRAQSLHTMLLSFDTLIVSFIGGFIIDSFGIKTLSLITFLFVLVGAVTFTILVKTKKDN